MNDRSPKHTDRRRLARGTNAEEIVHPLAGEDALDDAIQRGIAMLQAEQLEHTFFVPRTDSEATD